MSATIRNIGTRIAATALGFVLAATALLGSAAPAVAVSSPVAMLTVTSTSPGWYSVRVSGYIPMSHADAQARLNLGQQVVIRLWDYDFGNSDDLIFDGRYDNVYELASARGIEFGITWRTYTDKLDRDIGCETLYAGVRLMDGAVTVASAESNRVGGCFG